MHVDRFPFRLQQQPGSDNPLGRVKLDIPNRFDVYLHDTPSQQAFETSRRDFSHGCVRVAEPAALAAWEAVPDASPDCATRIARMRNPPSEE